MDSINGIDAIRLAQEVSKLPDGNFKVAFYPCDLALDEVSARLDIRKNCKARAQMPQDKWEADGDTYFLFSDEKGDPKTCHRVLLRFIGFPPEYKLRKVEWFKSNAHGTD